jgi:signal transduction histidine kinase
MTSETDNDLEGQVDAIGGGDAAGRELLRQRDRLLRLERLLGTGLMLLSADGKVRLANQRAREMYQLGDREGAEVEPPLADLIAGGRSEDGPWEVEVEPAGHPLRATVTSCEDGASLLVELRDDRALAGLETDLLTAARVRNLTRLYAGLTHDLRAPLHGITLHLELLRRGLQRGRETGAGGDGLDPVARLEVVATELHRLQRRFDLILDQAVPAEPDESGIFDLRDVVSELGDLLRPQARQEGKQVEVELPDRQAVVETTQRDQVKQALLSVAVNGLEAMSAGGRLALRLNEAGDRVRVEISDTGPGVEEEIREHLFDVHVTDKVSGLGAGLFFARSLLESEGGTLELTSTSTRGTTFTVELPAAGAG